VLGSVGPGTKLPSLGHITYDEVERAIAEQCAGLLAGDQVVSIQGRPIVRATEIIDVLRVSAGTEVAIEIRRGGVEQRILVTPEAQPSERAEDNGRPVGRRAFAISAIARLLARSLA
jgi:C-terminal processing protease CtpA/Prc